MKSNNYDFWKSAFDKKLADISDLARMAISNQITLDEFQEITGADYIPNITDGSENYISTKNIMTDLANSRIDSMKKNIIINDLTQQVAENKILNIQKDTIINNLTKQMVNNKLEIMKIKTEKAGN